MKAEEPCVESPVSEKNTLTTAMQISQEKTKQEPFQAEPQMKQVAGEEVLTENPNETNPPRAVAPIADAKSMPRQNCPYNPGERVS